MKRFLSFTVVALIALSAGIGGFYLHQNNQTAQFLKAGVFIIENSRPLKTFKLNSHDGKPFTKESFTGHWHLVFFGFTHCPDICPTTLATLKQTWNKLPPNIQKEIKITLVSVDPARDTVEKMKQYVGFFGKDIIGVTGDFMELTELTTSLSVPFKKIMLEGGNYTVDHSAYIYLIGPDGHFRAFIKPPFHIESLSTTLPKLINHIQNT
ncbi:MAG: SCO family protein [Cellvibrionales bacterium]|nr:SCO family protein [Cellvibrionales bacterium]